MKKVLVTGGTGYIGSHTVVELQQNAYEVVIADDLSNSSSAVVDGIHKITGKRPIFEEVDLSDRAACKAMFDRHADLAAVIHFAASKAVGESVQKPLLYYRNNLDSLLYVLENMERLAIPNFVFSSSCTVYGQPDQLPVNESAAIKKAESPYGNTKQIAEEIIADQVKTAHLKSICLRYFNPIGAHETALIGELPLGVPNNLIPYITQTAIGKRACLQVFGDDYKTSDGTPVRDYIHVVDLAQAHVIALERMLSEQQKAAIEFFNLGTGRGYSVLEIIQAFERVSNKKLNYKIVGRREGDIEQIWADPTFANQELGWKSSKNLDDMLLSAWNWELKLEEQA